MKLSQCQGCGQQLFFENTRCGRCGRRTGFIPARMTISALDEVGRALRALLDGRRYRFCRNADHEACNWLVPEESGDAFCAACRHNVTIPDISNPDNLAPWRKMEAAKRRLFYSLLRFGLPRVSRVDDPQEGLGFEFLKDPDDPQAPKVMTGHDEGIITITLAEADDAERERRRTAMGEPYRTLLGHFRHEVGHWYWDRLVRDDPGQLARVRAAFGDDREDYAEAVKRHYEEGAPPDWPERFISAYATTHAWEDWAESFAHYLHIVEVLDTVRAYGMGLVLDLPQESRAVPVIDFDPYAAPGIRRLIDAWLPYSTALNSANRAIGLSDLYPFVLSAPAIEKLGVVHDVLAAAREIPPLHENRGAARN